MEVRQNRTHCSGVEAEDVAYFFMLRMFQGARDFVQSQYSSLKVALTGMVDWSACGRFGCSPVTATFSALAMSVRCDCRSLEERYPRIRPRYNHLRNSTLCCVHLCAL